MQTAERSGRRSEVAFGDAATSHRDEGAMRSATWQAILTAVAIGLGACNTAPSPSTTAPPHR